MALKLDNVIRPYTGGDGRDFSEWLRKFEVIGVLQKWPKLEEVIPLFLDGSAFNIYDQMLEADKKDYDKVKAALLGTFSLRPSEAYEAFVHRKLGTGEQVEVLLADLKRLAVLVGYTQTDLPQADPFIRGQFLRALPDEVSRQVSSSIKVSTMTLVELCTLAKQVASELNASRDGALVGAMVHGTRSASAVAPRTGNSGGVCYRCSKAGHVAKNCRAVTPVVAQKGRARCFRCNQEGHFAARCEAAMPFEGNGQWGE
jgi:hypothetical protein